MKLQKYIVILKRTATSASTSFLDHRVKHCSAGWKRRELSVSHPLSKHLWNGNLPNLWVWGLGEIVIQQDFTRQNSTCTMTVSCWKPPPHLCCRRWVRLTTTGQADHSAITFTLIGTLLLFSSTVIPPLFWWLPHLVPLHQDYPKPVLFISKAHNKSLAVTITQLTSNLYHGAVQASASPQVTLTPVLVRQELHLDISISLAFTLP